MKKYLIAAVALFAFSAGVFADSEKVDPKEIDREIAVELAMLKEQIARDMDSQMKVDMNEILREEKQEQS